MVWVMARVRVRVWVRREMLTCPMQGSNSVTVFVTLRGYRQTNSAQALNDPVWVRV